MAGQIYGQNYSVRIPHHEAARFDGVAASLGLKRSELLRHLILRAIDEAPVLSGEDRNRARTIGKEA